MKVRRGLTRRTGQRLAERGVAALACALLGGSREKGLAVLACALLLMGGCEGVPEQGSGSQPPSSAEKAKEAASPASADGGARSGASAGVKEAAPPEIPADAGRWPAVAFGPEGALALVGSLREASGTPESLRSWAARYAAYPFDVDGAEQAGDLTALMKGLGEHLSDLSAAMAPFEVCEVRSRAQILGGEPMHFMDRLGGRPSGEELRRDLDRMGLGEGRLLVNCYHEARAGFFLIVTDQGGQARVVAIRM